MEFVRGRYRLEKALSSGGIGQVFAAFDEKEDSPVAVKLTPLPDGALQAIAPHLTDSTATLRWLRHPNLVHIGDIFVEDNRIAIVMELSQG